MFLQLKLQKKNYTHVIAWNPHDSHLSTSGLHHSTTNDPCSLALASIFASKYSVDYEELVNLFKDTPDVKNQLSFAKKEHMFNVALFFHMSYKMPLHYSLIQMDIKHTILQEMIPF